MVPLSAKQISLDSPFNSTVQRQVTGVESGINQLVFVYHRTADIYIKNLKILALSITKNRFQHKKKLWHIGTYLFTGLPLQRADSGKLIHT
jgi:hypothetical protein